MKRGYGVIICLALVLLLSLSFVSAGFLGDTWKRITGEAVSGTCGSYSYASPQDAEANSEYSAIFAAEKAIDGKTNTYWFGKGDGFPKWLKLDLGDKKCVNGIKLNIFTYDVPLTFDIEVSDDGETWEAVEEGLKVESTGNKEFSFDEVAVRYVRVYETAAKRDYGSVTEVTINSAPLNGDSITCPTYALPFCEGGTIVAGEVDGEGCQGPSTCVMDETCIDNCGNGVCTEFQVCGAVSCTCAETADNCPKDCVEETNETEIICNDSDGGKDYSVKGYLNNNQGVTFEDYCLSSSDLIERYCSDDPNKFTEQYTCPYGCSDGACLEEAITLVDGCEYLSNDVINKIDEIKSSDNYKNGDIDIILREGADVHYKEYIVFPSDNILKLSSVKNSTYGYHDDYVKFTDAISSYTYEATLTSEGVGNFNVGGYSYEVTYSGNSFSASNEHIVTIDFPQTSGNNKLTFEDCVATATCTTDSDCGISATTTSCENNSLCHEQINYYCENSKCLTHVGSYCNDCAYGCENETCIGGNCDLLIEKMKNPSDFSEYDVDYILRYNYSYSGSWWIDGQIEPLTEYYASWNTYYDEKNYYVSYSVGVFDNENMNLESWLEQRTDYSACKATSYWSTDNKENKVYICNWNMFYNQQDLDQYQYNSREVLWIKDNIFVQMSVSYGGWLNDEEFSQIAQERMNDFLDNLQNNEFEQVDWDNFNIDWPLSYLVEKELSSCPSEIDLGTCSACWQCKTEPVVCPPHGQQTNTCVDYCCGGEDIEQTMYCSPGECAGCYVPMWSSGDYESKENKCIPYGFRFEQTSDNFIEIERTYEDNEILYEDDFDNEDELSLDIISENKAILTFYWKNETYEYTLIPGEQVIVDIPWSSDADYLFFTNEIFYANEGESYVDLTIKYTYMGKTYDTINSYCDIDGRVHIQKIMDYNGNWASCQNNYECESNICSSGECIEVTSMIAEASGFKSLFVRVLCRLAHMFNEDNYSTCIAGFLNEGSSSSGGGSSGGGTATTG